MIKIKFKFLSTVINILSLLIILTIPAYSSPFKSTDAYEFILFYSTTCPHCLKFAPTLRQYSDKSGIPIQAFAVNGNKSHYFPNSIPLTQETIEQFFGKNASLALPSLFLLNKKNLHAYPVSQGALTYTELQLRMSKLIPKTVQFENGRGIYDRQE